MMNDPVIDEVRRVRKLISSEIGTNLSNLVEHYSKYESMFKAKPIEATDRRTDKASTSRVLTDASAKD